MHNKAACQCNSVHSKQIGEDSAMCIDRCSKVDFLGNSNYL